MRKKLKVHDGNTPGKVLEVKLEYQKPKVATMSDMKCPFCGEELYYTQEIDGGFDILTCNCPASFWLFGNDKMWYNLEKTITELDRTRKALDVAVDALKDFSIHPDDSVKKYAKKTLEQITALEQKDK